MRNFPITDKADTLITADTNGDPVEIDPSAQNDDVHLDNRGATDVHAALGDENVQATTSHRRIPAGAIVTYDKGSATHISLLTASGTSVVAVAVGRGS